MTYLYVLDAGAVLRLVSEHGTRLAGLLYDASAHGCAAAVPVTCLRAATAAVAAGPLGERLRTVLGAPVLKVTLVPDADRPMMRTAAARVGDAELAHAAVEALAR